MRVIYRKHVAWISCKFSQTPFRHTPAFLAMLKLMDRTQVSLYYIGFVLVKRKKEKKGFSQKEASLVLVVRLKIGSSVDAQYP